MTIYHLIFRYGHFDDYQEYYLGAYSSSEKREEAILSYRSNFDSSGQPSFLSTENCYLDHGAFEKFETELDESLYLTDS